MVKLGISGATGRMGMAIQQEIRSCFEDSVELGGLYSRQSKCTLSELFTRSDVIVDFSLPSQVSALLHEAQHHKTPLMIGTTGLLETDFIVMNKLALTIPILYAPNTSFGIFVMKQLTRKVAELLPEEYNIAILDKHHIHKQDSPSGTAIALRDVLQQVTNKGRDEYPIASMRLGGIAGDHDVIVANEHEKITISHSLLNGRRALASGAIKAALAVVNQKPGRVYSIEDIV